MTIRKPCALRHGLLHACNGTCKHAPCGTLLCDCADKDDKLNIIMEYASKGNVAMLIKVRSVWVWEQTALPSDNVSVQRDRMQDCTHSTWRLGFELQSSRALRIPPCLWACLKHGAKPQCPSSGTWHGLASVACYTGPERQRPARGHHLEDLHPGQLYSLRAWLRSTLLRRSTVRPATQHGCTRKML